MSALVVCICSVNELSNFFCLVELWLDDFSMLMALEYAIDWWWGGICFLWFCNTCVCAAVGNFLVTTYNQTRIFWVVGTAEYMLSRMPTFKSNAKCRWLEDASVGLSFDSVANCHRLLWISFIFLSNFWTGFILVGLEPVCGDLSWMRYF